MKFLGLWVEHVRHDAVDFHTFFVDVRARVGIDGLRRLGRIVVAVVLVMAVAVAVVMVI